MKKLYRSRKNSVIAGVCGGLGEYFDIDVVFIRLVFVFLGFTGVGFLAYLAAALVLPRAPREDEEYLEEESSHNPSFILGAGLVLLGIYMLFNRFLIHLLPSYTKDLLWPLIFIGLGAYLVWGRKES